MQVAHEWDEDGEIALFYFCVYDVFESRRPPRRADDNDAQALIICLQQTLPSTRRINIAFRLQKAQFHARTARRFAYDDDDDQDNNMAQTLALKLICVAMVVALVTEETAANVAIGRSGSVRPGKRSLALGRFNLRPGKRSIIDSINAIDVDTNSCNPSDIADVTNVMENLVPHLEKYVVYLERCTDGNSDK
uniref:Uncharacterized protein n=1 Tax=Plectus sambesii TaxID=2011161 RepID=A0A914V439_9BILA